MPARLKVYGITLFVPERDRRHGHRQARCIVVARSKTEAARLFGTSVYHMRDFGCETGNQTEIAVAFSAPGEVFYQVEDYKPIYTKRLPRMK